MRVLQYGEELPGGEPSRLHPPTGDGCLRDLALTQKIEVHGFLWIIDEMNRHQLRAADLLCAALRVLADDFAVRLPKAELSALIKRLQNV